MEGLAYAGDAAPRDLTMRWPWSKREPERRQSGGGFTDRIVAAIEATASAQVADASSTAAVEAAAGALSRALMACEVEAPGWAQDAVSPPWLAQVGRSIVREGASLSTVEMRGDRLTLIPAAFWSFESQTQVDDSDEESWQCRTSTYGPLSSVTRLLPRQQLVFVRWGTSPGTRYRGQGPTSWAHLTARLQGEVERSLADESGGPLAQLLTTPEGTDTDSDDDSDPWAAVRASLKGARGGLALLETVATGGGDGPSARPARDWDPRRLGPAPTEAMVKLSDQAFMRMLSACGCPPSMFISDDGTAQREALRRWHMNTVVPITRLLEHELTRRLEVDVRLRHDGYAMDLVSRAQVVDKLVRAGVPIATAMAAVSLEEAQ